MCRDRGSTGTACRGAPVTVRAGSGQQRPPGRGGWGPALPAKETPVPWHAPVGMAATPTHPGGDEGDEGDEGGREEGSPPVPWGAWLAWCLAWGWSRPPPVPPAAPPPAQHSPGRGCAGCAAGTRGWTLPGGARPREGEALKCCAGAKRLRLNLPPPSQLLTQLFCAALYRDLISPVR